VQGTTSDRDKHLRGYCTGSRQFRIKLDVTEVLEDRAIDIKKFDSIIVALEQGDK
jgi:hypothetical protein